MSARSSTVSKWGSTKWSLSARHEMCHLISASAGFTGTNTLHPLIHESAVERRSVPRHIRNPRIGFHLHKAASGSLHLSEARNVSNWGVFFTTDSPVTLGARIDLLIEMPTEFSGPVQWLCWGRVVRVEAQDASDTMLGIAVKYDCYEVVRPAAPIDSTS
jgi:hypothetical protein